MRIVSGSKVKITSCFYTVFTKMATSSEESSSIPGPSGTLGPTGKPADMSAAPCPFSPPLVKNLAISGRRRESTVWDYFVFDAEKVKSICQVEVSVENSSPRLCATEIAGKYPTNLKSHLKKAHPSAHDEMVQKEEAKQREKERAKAQKKITSPTQVTLQESIEKGQQYDKASQRYKDITQKLAMFVSVGNVANSIVECEEFRELILQLDHRYPIPSRAALDTEMDALLKKVRDGVSTKLRDAGKIALCTDIWSRKGMTQSFIGVTAHFLTKCDNRRWVATLAVQALPSPHTADRIEDAVCTILRTWEIPSDKISAILTDNGSNMIAAFKNQVQQNEATEDESEDESNGSAHFQSPASSVKSSDGDGEDQDMDMDIDSGVASDALKEIEQFDQLELQHDVAFSVQKRLSCFNHTLQLVVRMFDTSHQSVLYSQLTGWPRNFQTLLKRQRD